MTAARSYKRAQTAVAAREELARCAGTQFDPVIVRAFLSISLGRMRLAMGPLAWVTQVPLFSELPRLANALQLVGSFFGAVGAAVMIGAPSLAEETAVEDVRSTRAIAATASEDSSEVTASEDPSEALKGAAPDVMPAVEPLPDPTPAADIPPLGELTFEVSLPAPAPQVPAQDPVPTTPEPPPPPEPASEPASPPPSPSPSPSASPSEALPAPSEPSEPLPAPSPTATPSPSPSPPPAPVVNAAPAATDDSAMTNEDTPVVVNVLANDTDGDPGDTLVIQSFDATAITNGTLANNGGGQFQFFPAPDFSGTQSFTYEDTDGTDVATATVTIAVAAVHDPPSFTAGADQTVAEDAGPQSVTQRWTRPTQMSISTGHGPSRQTPLTRDRSG